MVHYDVHGKPPLSYFVIHMKPNHSFPSISLTAGLISLFHLWLGLASVLFLSGFCSKTRVQFSVPLYGSHALSIPHVEHYHPGRAKACGWGNLRVHFKTYPHRSVFFSVTRIRWLKAIHKINMGSHPARGHVFDTMFLVRHFFSVILLVSIYKCVK
jgi:hypothetical protein